MKDTHQTDPEKILEVLKELQDKDCIATFKIEHLMKVTNLSKGYVYKALNHLLETKQLEKLKSSQYKILIPTKLSSQYRIPTGGTKLVPLNKPLKTKITNVLDLDHIDDSHYFSSEKLDHPSEHKWNI